VWGGLVAMLWSKIGLLTFVAAVCFVLPSARGQMAASRLGVEDYVPEVNNLPLLTRENAESFISLDGRAEVRVQPTQVRIVLAVTSEGKTAQDCQRLIQQAVAGLKARWQQLKIAPENIVEDFIAVLPVHEWRIEKRGESEAGVEQRVGFRMQTNVHIAVTNDDTATAVLGAAFEQGITDIIAVDYWSPDLDSAKTRARELALKAARSKADTLLAALFDTPPSVINVQEQTKVRYPESLYDRFENTYQEEVTPAWKSELPFLRAYRPRNTYYRGLQSDGDVQPAGLPMRPEISVVSTVRLYYESPAAKRPKDAAVPAK
jgi:uncharacterized protein YggE